MKNMLVLLSRPEDVGSRLPELRDIVRAHNVTKVYVARVLPPFGARVRSIASPHKLEMAARMSEAAAARYLSIVGSALGSGTDVEIIGTGIAAGDIDRFIENRHLDLIVTTDTVSALCRWPRNTADHSLVTTLCLPSRA